jgi:hypothetical protein
LLQLTLLPVIGFLPSVELLNGMAWINITYWVFVTAPEMKFVGQTAKYTWMDHNRNEDTMNILKYRIIGFNMSAEYKETDPIYCYCRKMTSRVV